MPNHADSLLREKRIVAWLESVRHDAEIIYLVGDLFDYWFEYKSVVPKYYTRFLGKLAELTDAGICIEVFSGNHDVWLFDYFKTEFGIIVHHSPIERNFGDKNFYIAHGDGLGPDDKGYKFIKKIFRNSVCQWLFRQLHPDVGSRLAKFFSHSSRSDSKRDGDHLFLGEDKEWLIFHSKELLKYKQVDFFIYGHRHLPMQLEIGDSSIFTNLGDWITHFTYAVFDGKKLELKTFNS
ncbi:MAG: UDP-2,3-diacylglucosamine diphosphatase [Flavobacteriaceae bacterium]|nr:UDP-2,3-diacylglucosamine diphosphatase [Flavobacteriaceae bacterium]